MKGLKVGNSRCACAECNECFNSLASFDRHRTGKHSEGRRCLTAPEMRADGMSENSAGYWITAERIPTDMEAE